MSSYRLVMRAFPAEYRQEHGAELVDTANALTDNRWSARQSLSLFNVGLRTRTRIESGDTVQRTWIQGAMLGLLLMLTTHTTYVWSYGSWDWGGRYALEPLLSALSVILLIRSTSSRSIAGVALLQLGAALSVGFFAIPFLAAPVSLLAGLGGLSRRWGDGRPAGSPTMVAIVILALSFGPLADLGDGFLGGFVLQCGLLALGLTLVRLDPRPLIGAGAWFALELLPGALMAGIDSDESMSTAAYAAIAVALAAFAASAISIRHPQRR